jgi:hypothetical protein
VERKLSNFFAENVNKIKIWKRKRNFAERKRKFFGENGNGNEIAFSGGIDVEIEVSVSNYMTNLASPKSDLVILNRQNNPSPYSLLHRVIMEYLGNKFFYLLNLFEFFCTTQVASWFQ